MLILSRKKFETINIGDDIRIVIQNISGNRVQIGIEAPKEITVLRGELRKESNDGHKSQKG